MRWSELELNTKCTIGSPICIFGPPVDASRIHFSLQFLLLLHAYAETALV